MYIKLTINKVKNNISVIYSRTLLRTIMVKAGLAEIKEGSKNFARIRLENDTTGE